MSAPRARRSASSEETERLGESLAPTLERGDLIALVGPLGAGKTRFVSGLARGLRCSARVRSPSFTLVNEYPGELPLFHLDLYRLEPAEVESLGLEDYLGRGVVAVEWGEKLPNRWLTESLLLEFRIGGEHEREVEAKAREGRGLNLLGAWTDMTRAAPVLRTRERPARGGFSLRSSEKSSPGERGATRERARPK